MVTYFENTYLYGNYQPQEWNHFSNFHERTNNRVEADNHTMKKYCGATNPNVVKAVRLLQQYETTSKDKYYIAHEPNPRAP